MNHLLCGCQSDSAQQTVLDNNMFFCFLYLAVFESLFFIIASDYFTHGILEPQWTKAFFPCQSNSGGLKVEGSEAAEKDDIWHVKVKHLPL